LQTDRDDRQPSTQTLRPKLGVSDRRRGSRGDAAELLQETLLDQPRLVDPTKIGCSFGGLMDAPRRR
jgi:hypothetical protein